MNEITGVLIDTLNETAGIKTIEASLESYYKHLHCDIIDIVNRKIGKRRFDIICDDEGLFKDPVLISAIDNMGNPQLVGSIFIVNGNNNTGELESLTEEDQLYILARVRMLCTNLHPIPYPILTHLGF